MGTTVSRAKLPEYKEVVKGRMSEEDISFLFAKFTAAAPDGAMGPLEFKRYMDSTGAYKNGKIAAQQQRLAQEEQARRTAGGAAWAQRNWFGSSKGAASRTAAEDAAAFKRSEAMDAKSSANKNHHDGDDDDDDHIKDDGELYPHLFRGYDLDGDGTITFKEFLIYHLAVIHSTEELVYIIFNTFDEDQDGFLSLGDLKAVITASTRYVSDYDVRDREVNRVIDEEARRLMAFLDIRQQGRVQRDDMRLIAQKYPQVLEKMKNLM